MTLYDVSITTRTNNGTLADYSGYDKKAGIPSDQLSSTGDVGTFTVYFKRTGTVSGNITAHISDGSGTILYNSGTTLDASTVATSDYTAYSFTFSGASISTGDIIYVTTTVSNDPNVSKIDYAINTPTGDLVRQLQGSSTWQTRTDRRWCATITEGATTGGVLLPPPYSEVVF